MVSAAKEFQQGKASKGIRQLEIFKNIKGLRSTKLGNVGFHGDAADAIAHRIREVSLGVVLSKILKLQG
jgi:hypothetical protein